MFHCDIYKEEWHRNYLVNKGLRDTASHSSPVIDFSHNFQHLQVLICTQISIFI